MESKSSEPNNEENQCYICRNTANLNCSICGKSICNTHVYSNYSKNGTTEIRCNYCKAEKNRKLNRIWIIFSVVPVILLIIFIFFIIQALMESNSPIIRFITNFIIFIVLFLICLKLGRVLFNLITDFISWIKQQMINRRKNKRKKKIEKF